jgi:hypothetical protein
MDIHLGWDEFRDLIVLTVGFFLRELRGFLANKTQAKEKVLNPPL